LCNVSLSEASFQVSHLLKHQSTVWQTPERFFVRLERALEVAKNPVAINALREPCFPELGLKRDRAIGRFLHCGAAVLVQINAVEIEIASRDSEAGPRLTKSPTSQSRSVRGLKANCRTKDSSAEKQP